LQYMRTTSPVPKPEVDGDAAVIVQVSEAWPSSPPLTVIAVPLRTAIEPLMAVYTGCVDVVVVGSLVVVVVVEGPSSVRLSPTSTPLAHPIFACEPTA